MGKFKAKIGDRIILSDRAPKSYRTAFGTRTGIIELLQVLQHRTTYVATFPVVSRKISSRVGLFSHEFNLMK